MKIKTKIKFKFDSSEFIHRHVRVISSKYNISVLRAKVTQDMVEVTEQDAHEIPETIRITGHMFCPFSDQEIEGIDEPFDIILLAYDPINDIPYRAEFLNCLIERWKKGQAWAWFIADRFVDWHPAETVEERERRLKILKSRD